MQLHSEPAHSACYAGTSGGACSWGGGRGALSGHPPSAEEPSTFTSSSPCCSAGASCSRYSCTAGGRARRVSGAGQGVPNTAHGRACSSSRQRVATRPAGRRPELRRRRSSWSAAGPNPGPETGASIRRDRQRCHLNVLPKGGSLLLVLGRELVRQEGRRIHVQAAPAAAGVRAARLRSACGTLVQAGAMVGQHASCCGRPAGRLPALLPHFRGTCPSGNINTSCWRAASPALGGAKAAAASSPGCRRRSHLPWRPPGGRWGTAPLAAAASGPAAPAPSRTGQPRWRHPPGLPPCGADGTASVEAAST